jgi:hypothetical protein
VWGYSSFERKRVGLGLLAAFFALAGVAAFDPSPPDYCVCTLIVKEVEGVTTTECSTACGPSFECTAVWVYWDPETEINWEACLCNGPSDDDDCLCFGMRNEADHAVYTCSLLSTRCNTTGHTCQVNAGSQWHLNACKCAVPPGR